MNAHPKQKLSSIPLFALALAPAGSIEVPNTPDSRSPVIIRDQMGTRSQSWNSSDYNLRRVNQSGESFMEGILNRNDIDVRICKNHFPRNTPARQEIETGIDYFRQVKGLNLSLSTGSYDHESINERFELLPAHGEIKIDYAYNSGNKGFIPCHKPTSSDPAERTQEQWGFLGNSCSHYSWGTWTFAPGDYTTASRISINPLSVTYSESEQREIKRVNLRHFWDVTGEALPYELENRNTIGYARAPLFSHELGHSLGMRHTPDWPSGKAFLSIMQSHLRTLTPFDLALLKTHYGLNSNENSEIRKKDLVASHLVRVDVSPEGSKKYKNFNFDSDDQNALDRISPLYLYATNGQYLDCQTRKSPRFHVNYFNNGLRRIPSTPSYQAEFTIDGIGRTMDGTLIPRQSVNLTTFNLPELQGLSQHYWSGQLLIPTASIGVPAPGSPRKTRVYFRLDPQNSLSEVSESNNELSAEVTLLSSIRDCREQEVEEVTERYYDSSGNIRGY